MRKFPIIGNTGCRGVVAGGGCERRGISEVMSEAPTFQKDQQHWFVRFSNRFGAYLLRDGRIPRRVSLKESVLFETAIRQTGYSDFGSESFREPLHVLLEGAQKEGNLNWSGRVSLRGTVMLGLRTRLNTEEAIKRFPEILDQPVRKPLIVVGNPRTGTTFLNHLLCLDPAARPLYLWEAMDPTPWKMQRNPKSDPRPTLLRFGTHLMKKFYPQYAIAHDYGYNVPDECQKLFWPTFFCFQTIAFPSYRDWLKGQPASRFEWVYTEYRRAIQMLHWQRPATGHWVLKSPEHAWSLQSLMNAVPEASIVQTHRNMKEVVPSVCSLGAIIATMFSDEVEEKKVGPYMMDFLHEVTDRIVTSHDKVDQNRLCDVPYRNLAADPAGTVRMIYEKFGYEFTPEHEQKIKEFVADKEPSRRPKHVYSMEQFGLDGASIDKTFAAYHEKFGLA